MCLRSLLLCSVVGCDSASRRQAPFELEHHALTGACATPHPTPPFSNFPRGAEAEGRRAAGARWTMARAVESQTPTRRVAAPLDVALSPPLAPALPLPLSPNTHPHFHFHPHCRFRRGREARTGGSCALADGGPAGAAHSGGGRRRAQAWKDVRGGIAAGCVGRVGLRATRATRTVIPRAPTHSL